MLRTLMLTLLAWSCQAAAQYQCTPADALPGQLFPVVKLETSLGDIVVELNRTRAPVTTGNFLQYMLDGHYDGTIFHRVVPGFVVQGGGYDADFNERPVREPIVNESGNGLRNNAWTIAMARFNDPHSATNQFYFNLSNNESLDPNSSNWGYAVFGDVIEGREVLEAIAQVKTGYHAALDAQDVPQVAVILERVSLVEE